MGINDIHNDSPYKDLFMKLIDPSDGKTDNEKIAEWMTTFNESDFSSFDQAYALALKTMVEKYPDAEIWCVTLNNNNDSRFNASVMKQYNREITALAKYFGANVINQQKGYINADNCHAYTNDGNCLHPNSAGHALMEKYIVECFYQEISK